MTSSKSIWQSVVLAAFLIAISLAAAWSARVGTIPGDWPTRITMILSMLMIAYYGNTIPKVIAREAAARRALRLAGWAFVLAGLASAALWAFAPLDAATPVSIALVGGAVVLAFGSCLRVARQKAE